MYAVRYYIDNQLIGIKSKTKQDALNNYAELGDQPKLLSFDFPIWPGISYSRTIRSHKWSE